MASLYPLGTIVIAFMRDEYGENPKDRPAMVLSGETEDDPGTLEVAGITTTFTDDDLQRPGRFLVEPTLGDVSTGLTKRSCIVSTWIWRVKISTCVMNRWIGFMPDEIIDKVLDHLNSLGI